MPEQCTLMLSRHNFIWAFTNLGFQEVNINKPDIPKLLVIMLLSLSQ